MNYQIDTKHTGPSDARTEPLDEGVVHTTEGESTAGDLTSLTGKDPGHIVSVQEYIARPEKEVVTDYQIVPATRVAYHVGYIHGPTPGTWIAGGNKTRYGWELGHKAGEKWNPLHLAVSFDIIRTRTQALKLTSLVRHSDLASGRPKLYGGPRSDPTDFPFWPEFRQLCFLPPYPLTIPVDASGRRMPDLSLAVFADVLARRGAFSAAAAAAFYQTILAHGLQPGPLLALFGQESEWGTTDAKRLNWGNVRDAWEPKRQVTTESHGLAVFRSFDDSLLDICERIVGHPAYLPNGNNDVTTLRVIWSPVGDGINNPFADALRMRGWLADWVAQSSAGAPAAPDYHALWGTFAPYIADFGIPQWFRAQVDAGFLPGNALNTEYSLPDGTTRQDFEHAVAVYTPGTGTVTWSAR